MIVEHVSGQFNLYLSDITGVYFSLSLPDIVNENYFIDLELVSRSLASFVTKGGGVDLSLLSTD